MMGFALFLSLLVLKLGFWVGDRAAFGHFTQGMNIYRYRTMEPKQIFWISSFWSLVASNHLTLTKLVSEMSNLETAFRRNTSFAALRTPISSKDH